MIFGIIDYGAGNLLSVKNAFDALGADTRVVRTAEELDDVGAIVLPGVGAFAQGMSGLREHGLLEGLQLHVQERKKPMLGICLGMQLLASRGFELGTHDGLGWVPGDVVKLDGLGQLRVPHIGWNEVAGKGSLFKGLAERASFYFVHSFHLAPQDAASVAGTTDYGIDFVSAVEVDNIVAVQFHPEKSHKVGLALLKNFVAFAGRA